MVTASLRGYISKHLPLLLFFFSKGQFLLPEPKMPILGPRPTTGDRSSGLYVPVVSLTLCCRACTHSCDRRVSTVPANGTSVRHDNWWCIRRGARGSSPSLHSQCRQGLALSWVAIVWCCAIRNLWDESLASFWVPPQMRKSSTPTLFCPLQHWTENFIPQLSPGQLLTSTVSMLVNANITTFRNQR